MARYETTYTATMGRDKGKRFLLTEMKPRASHLWATRMMLGMIAGGVEISEDIASQGLAGLATMAMSAIGKIPEEKAVPLLDQLIDDCAQSVQDIGTRALVESDIEEFVTFFQIQKAVFQLHVNPFITDGLSTSGSPVPQGQPV